MQFDGRIFLLFSELLNLLEFGRTEFILKDRSIWSASGSESDPDIYSYLFLFVSIKFY